MANIATNEVIIIFKENTSVEDKEEVIKYMEDNLVYDGIYNEITDCDLEDFNCQELSYGTRWSERPEILQEICNKFDVQIIGVCYEWGCLYANSFDVKKEE